MNLRKHSLSIAILLAAIFCSSMAVAQLASVAPAGHHGDAFPIALLGASFLLCSALGRRTVRLVRERVSGVRKGAASEHSAAQQAKTAPESVGR